MASDASSRELVSELSKTAGGPAGIAALLGVWKPTRLQGKRSSAEQSTERRETGRRVFSFHST